MKDEQIQNTGAIEENRPTDESSENDTGLGAENRQLRERIDNLEAALGDIRDELADVKNESDGDATGIESPEARDGADATPELVTNGGQPTKIIGKFDDDDGIGVLGSATGDGETYGVMGEVDSNDGYGLYTPDDAGVEGRFEVGNNILVQSSGNARIYFTDTSIRLFHSEGFPKGGDYLGTGGTTDAFWVNNRLEVNDFTPQRTAGPVAKGSVDQDGTLAHGINVGAVEWNDSEERYEISLIDDEYWYDEFATYVTTRSTAVSENLTWGTGSSDGKLLVVPSDGNTWSFQFVTHKLIAGESSGADTAREVSTDEELSEDEIERSSEPERDNPEGKE